MRLLVDVLQSEQDCLDPDFADGDGVHVVLGPEITSFVDALANSENSIFSVGLLIAGHANGVVAAILLDVLNLSLWVEFGNFAVNLGAIVDQ
jgi:hypothetical protein